MQDRVNLHVKPGEHPCLQVRLHSHYSGSRALSFQSDDCSNNIFSKDSERIEPAVFFRMRTVIIAQLII